MRFVAQHDGHDIPIDVERSKSGYRIRMGEEWIHVDLVDAGPPVRSLRLENGQQFSILHHREGTEHQITLGNSTVQVGIIDPLAARRRGREDESASGGMVRALMPGRIVRVLVSEGDTVAKGDGLLILEAMKMENEIAAPIAGVVRRLFVEPGQTVESGAELVECLAGTGG